MDEFKNLVITDEGTKSLLDKDEFPAIDIHELQDIFLLSITDEYRKKNFTTYKFYDIHVPRVSEILKECINKEFLVRWAANIGKKEMYLQQKKATTIGTAVHQLIEDHLHGKPYSEKYKYKVPNHCISSIQRAYNNFIDWENNLNSMGYFIDDIIGTEVPISCPFYGGTIDCIASINGMTYILDWKTSKQISFEYIIQVCAYLWVINSGYMKNLPHIDGGVGIIRVDKEKKKYEDLFLNLHIPEQKQIIDYYIQGFGALLNSFYNIINMKNLYSYYKKNYNIESSLGGNNYVFD